MTVSQVVISCFCVLQDILEQMHLLPAKEKMVDNKSENDEREPIQ
jgi:hypothetical protein